VDALVGVTSTSTNFFSPENMKIWNFGDFLKLCKVIVNLFWKGSGEDWIRGWEGGPRLLALYVYSGKLWEPQPPWIP
jgi:hypothetical protein